MRIKEHSDTCAAFPETLSFFVENLKSLPNPAVHFWPIAYLYKVLLRRGYVNQYHFVISGTLRSFGDLMFGEYE